MTRGGKGRRAGWGATLWIVLAAAVPAGLAGQRACTRPVATLALGVSVDRHASRDPLVTSRPWSGTGLTQNGFRFTLDDGCGRHELEGWFGTLPVESDRGFVPTRDGRAVGATDSDRELVDVNWAYLWRLGARWSAGVTLLAQASHTRYEMGSGFAESYLYFGGFGVAGGFREELGPRSLLSISVRVPLAGWMARPTFSTVDERRLRANSEFWQRVRNGESFTVGDLQSVSGHVELQQMLGEHVGLRGAMRFSWARVADDGYRQIGAGLELGLLFRWPGAER